MTFDYKALDNLISKLEKIPLEKRVSLAGEVRQARSFLFKEMRNGNKAKVRPYLSKLGKLFPPYLVKSSKKGKRKKNNTRRRKR